MKIITSKPECVWKSKTLLGEGTLWVKPLNSIFFTDIKKKIIYKIKVDKNLNILKKNIFKKFSKPEGSLFKITTNSKGMITKSFKVIYD